MASKKKSGKVTKPAVRRKRGTRTSSVAPPTALFYYCECKADCTCAVNDSHHDTNRGHKVLIVTGGTGVTLTFLDKALGSPFKSYTGLSKHYPENQITEETIKNVTKKTAFLYKFECDRCPKGRPIVVNAEVIVDL